MPFLIEGRPAPTSPSVRGEGRVETRQTANYIAVTPGFFSTMRIPIVRGRDFDEHDAAGRPNVAIVNRAFVRRYFPDGNPIGKRISLDFVPNEPQREIVAIVGAQPRVLSSIKRNRRFTSTDAAVVAIRRRLGLPARRHDVRASHVGGTDAHRRAVKRAVAEVHPSTPVAAIQTMEQTLDAQIRHLRSACFLVGAFGAVAAVLAATGIYGVMAYSVAERTREIGIRMALGARAQDVLRMVLRQATWMIGIGLLVGLASALAVTRVIRSVLVEVTATKSGYICRCDCAPGLNRGGRLPRSHAPGNTKDPKGSVEIRAVIMNLRGGCAGEPISTRRRNRRSSSARDPVECRPGPDS